ncbi:MAG: hypothetical protein IKP36_08970 [Bacteroidaceae bacterium]|nr:hypothetical protein [Bacteroidaceae bacterium]
MKREKLFTRSEIKQEKDYYILQTFSLFSLLVLEKSLTLQSELPKMAKKHKVMCGAEWAGTT